VEAEGAVIERSLADLFGYHLVQVGVIAGVDPMAQSRILNRALVCLEGDELPGGYPITRGAAAALPVDSDSVDVVLMGHVLEFEPDPHAALREALRVLVPEGHLVIAAFNRWSLLGLWGLMPRCRHEVPWRGQFLGQNRLKDWLSLLGFELTAQVPCFFEPPLRNERLLRRLGVMTLAGRRMLPMCAAAYVMVARKRVTALTPIRPRWRGSRRPMAVGLAGPSVRVSDGE
jgi:SAM-dependent methyltransferase